MIWCGSNWTHLTWEDYFGIAAVCSSGIKTLFQVGNFIFMMLQLEIAPDNAATRGFSKVESAYCRHFLEDIASKSLVICSQYHHMHDKTLKKNSVPICKW